MQLDVNCQGDHLQAKILRKNGFEIKNAEAEIHWGPEKARWMLRRCVLHIVFAIVQEQVFSPAKFGRRKGSVHNRPCHCDFKKTSRMCNAGLLG